MMSSSDSSRMVLGLQYDGSDWQGWQSQPNGLTIQDRLHQAIRQFTHLSLKAIASGRTDAGVHAIQQVVHFDVDGVSRPEFAWVRGLNAFLPPSIRVMWARELNNNFHARFSATRRRYVYLLYQSPTQYPLFQQRKGWVFRPLNIESIQFAIPHLLGTRDFTSFRSTQCQASSPIRTLSNLNVRQYHNNFCFEFEADGFLHNMVRNLMAGLIMVGQGKRSPDWLSAVLEAKDRRLGPPTFMPDGLYFVGPHYGESWGLPQSGLQELLSPLGLSSQGYF